MNNEYTVVNKSTGKSIMLGAINEEIALITVFILEEEAEKQSHLPSWYRKEMVIIDISKTHYFLILGEWSIKVEKKR